MIPAKTLDELVRVLLKEPAGTRLSQLEAHPLFLYEPSPGRKAAAKKKIMNKTSDAARKANETSGPQERSRKARMARWTMQHGKDDAKNPFSSPNFYTVEEHRAVRASIRERSTGRQTR